MSKKLEAKIREERGATYGDATLGHHNLGLCWTGILQNHFKTELPWPIPADVVLLMMAALKLNRAAIDRGGEDHYADGRIYIELAAEAAEKTETNKI